MLHRSTILIVDDERFNITVLKELLDSEYDTMVARNGNQALQRVSSGALPDMILLDIMMPEMDGYEVCRRLKEDPKTFDIPVIFITAMNQAGDEAKGLELGAVDYVTKPINPVLLKLRIRNHLMIKKQSMDLKHLLQQQVKDRSEIGKIQTNLEKAQAIANLGSWDWEMGNDFVHLSYQAYKIYGVEPEEFKPDFNFLLERTCPEDRSIVERAIQSAVENPSSIFDVVHRITRPDGTQRFVHELGEVTRDEEGRPIVITAIIRDVTDSRAIEDELRLHRDNLAKLVEERTLRVKAIVETAVDAILTIDQMGIVETVNPAFEKIFGWPADEIIGRNVSLLIPAGPLKDDHDSFLKRFIQTRESRIIGVGREVTAMRWDGTVFPAFLSVGHSEFADGKHLFVGFLSDITKQKQNESELLLAKEAAEAGVKMKSSFIANMSHEIRTPMNAIIGFAEVLLRNATLSNETAKQVGIILSSARSLLNIINDILDVSKLESGKFSLEAVGFHLPNALTETLGTVEQAAAGKKLTLRFKYNASLPERFRGDPTRLRQVILNLVGNSIKFTETGSITVSVNPWENPGMLHFSVSDTGIGMTPKQAEKVFDSFSQADASTTRRFGGTGLGTTISKQIVELMGGKIWFESEPGRGSTFHFTVQMPEAGEGEVCLYETSKVVLSDYVPPRLFRILLAEDVEVNATLVTLRMEELGHTVDWVINGRQAVEKSQTESYDVILMDIMMPELDGVEATKEIRAIEKTTGAYLPILALTASVMREDHEKCRAAGMDGIVAKPIEFNQLFSAMEAVVAEGGGRLSRQLSGLDNSNLNEIDLSPLEEVIAYDKAIKTWRVQKVYVKALADFAATRLNDATVLEQLLREYPENVEPARNVVHALKGVAGNLGITVVARLADEIDSALRSGSREFAVTRLATLRQALGEAVGAIDRINLSDNSAGKPQKEFDASDVNGLLSQLMLSLDELNPDEVTPLLDKLGEYVTRGELALIQREVDAFDFSGAKARAVDLADKLGLQKLMKKILLVDDEPNNLQLLRQILKDDYQLIFANSGEKALDAAIKHRPDLILLDIMMPGMNGYKVCEKLKSMPATVGIPVIFVTAMSEVEDETRGFDAGAVDYILKPVSAPIVLRRVHTHLSLTRVQELEDSRREAIYMLGEAGHYNDTDTGVHIWRMAAYARALAEAAGWPKNLAASLEQAAPMHDTGKIGTPDAILKAPRKLTAEEWVIMKQHSQIGFDVMKKSAAPLFAMAAEIALCHHEKWDGSGYPQGLSGKAIPESARIVAIADVFDALTMKRPYKEPWSNEDAMAEIRKGSGSHFEPRLVELLESILPEVLKIKAEWEIRERSLA